MASGLCDKEIAQKLHLAEETVGWHLKKIFRLYRVHSRAALVARWMIDGQGRHAASGNPTNVGVVCANAPVVLSIP